MQRNRDGGAADPAQNPEVGLEAGIKQQHDHADPRHRLEQMVRDRVGRKDHRVQTGGEVSQDGRTQYDSSQQLADNGRLTKVLRGVGKCTRDHEQQRELDQEAQDLDFTQVRHQAALRTFRRSVGCGDHDESIARSVSRDFHFESCFRLAPTTGRRQRQSSSPGFESKASSTPQRASFCLALAPKHPK